MKKRIAILCMLCGVLVLSGCGGASSGRVDDLERRVNAAEPLVEQLRRDLEIAQTEAETAKTRAETAQAMADAAEIRATAAQAAADRAIEDRDTAQTEAAEAIAARDAAVRERDAAVAARDTAVADAAQARADLQSAEAARAAAEAQAKAEEEAKKEAEQADLNSRAGQFIGELDDTGTGTQRAATVAWMRGESKMVDPSGGTYTKGSAAPSISGFSGDSFTRQTATTTATTTTIIDETAYIYTNIQSPGTKAFWKKYGATGTSTEVTASVALRGSSAQPGEPDTTPTDPNNLEATQGRQFATLVVSGSFDGAAGRFTCATGCSGGTVGADRDGDDSGAVGIGDFVTFDNGVPTFADATNWIFTPNSLTTGVTLDQDEEFLYFGIWSSVPQIASEAHDFQVIFNGSNPYTSVGVVPSTNEPGTATFAGGAIGKYVTRNQVGQNARLGTFTADARLTATFGTAGSTPPGPTLSGTIDNFREGGANLSGWFVTLGGGGSPASAAEPVAFADGTVGIDAGLVAALIGGVPTTGTWAATLYGTPNVREDAATWPETEYPYSRYPTADLAGIAGRFEASNAIGTADASTAEVAIAGAFAATPN